MLTFIWYPATMRPEGPWQRLRCCLSNGGGFLHDHISLPQTDKTGHTRAPLLSFPPMRLGCLEKHGGYCPEGKASLLSRINILEIDILSGESQPVTCPAFPVSETSEESGGTLVLAGRELKTPQRITKLLKSQFQPLGGMPKASHVEKMERVVGVSRKCSIPCWDFTPTIYESHCMESVS